MGTWIKNAKVLHLNQDFFVTKHVLIEDGKIAKVVTAGQEEPNAFAGHETIDAKEQFLTAGFIDMHIHLREPGYEHKETIETGSLAAVKGGFTTIACMPNTNPVIDSPDVLKTVLDKGQQVGKAKLLSYACITKGEQGKELADFAALKEAGAAGFTDDGVGVQSAQVMKDAMELAASLDLPIVAHCEDDTLVVGAPVNEGTFADKHGFKGIPNESEAIHVGRDILLAETSGVHYHVCHVSTEQSVRLIRQAKQQGVNVTAEVCPHHLILSEEDIPEPDANWKMNPPLRSKRDVQAMIDALEDGTIDMLVTDHAPHSAEEKALGMLEAPFGIVGLETAFPLMYTHFVKPGILPLSLIIKKMTLEPARVIGLETGRIEAGAPADLTLIDLEQESTVDPAQFASKGKNTPFTGWKLQGWPTMTMVDGKIVWS